MKSALMWKSHASVVVLAMMGSGCLPQAFPADRLVLQARDAHYPVMLSETPALEGQGRAVRVVGGPWGPTPAQVLAEETRANEWIQIKQTVFRARHLTAEDHEVRLELEAEIHR